MTEKEMYLQSWGMEHQITTKVLNAYPDNRLDYKPHEVSKSAKGLALTFYGELGIVEEALNGNITMNESAPEGLNTMQDIITAFNNRHNELKSRVSDTSEEDLNKTVKFMVGPGQFADLRVMDVLWICFSDMIHHRGQFSVYLRLVGAKVPSIYGPSYDEPWN